MQTKNQLVLQLEGLTVFAASIYFYSDLGASWWLFAALILLPDLAMLGYVKSLKLGTICYNAMHNYVAPIILLIASLMWEQTLGLHIALIWIAHIGLDRALGYGLKYPTAFKDTHINLLNNPNQN